MTSSASAKHTLLFSLIEAITASTPRPSYFYSARAHNAVMAHYDNALRQMVTPVTGRMVPTRYGETHVLSAGATTPSAPAVVLLHGRTVNAIMWDRLMRGLGNAFRCYAVDVIGEPGKSESHRLPTHGPDYANWLGDVLDALNLPSAHFVGHSFGGWLSLKMAMTYPERVERLVPLATMGLFPARKRFVLRALLMVPYPTRNRLRALLEYLAPPGRKVEESSVHYMHLVFSNYFNNTKAPPPYADSDLQRVTQPTLLMLGANEVIFDPYVAAARARRCIPGLVSAELVPNAGHGLPGDRPDVVLERVQAFLTQ